MKYNPLYHLLHPLQVDERKIILINAKKDLRPKEADHTNNTQDNHQTDIFNAYHI